MHRVPILIEDRSTWPDPVEVKFDTPRGLVNRCLVEYTVPMSPAMMVVAVQQLPPEVPRDEQCFVRTMVSKSNVIRDKRNMGGFVLELIWPLTDIFTLPATFLSDGEDLEDLMSEGPYA